MSPLSKLSPSPDNYVLYNVSNLEPQIIRNLENIHRELVNREGEATKSDRSYMWAGILGGLGGTAGGIALGKLTDPFKGYKGTPQTVKDLKPSELHKLRLHVAAQLADIKSRKSPQSKASAILKELAEDLKANRPVAAKKLRALDYIIHKTGWLPTMQEGRLRGMGVVGLAAGSLGGLGINALRKRLKERKESAVGRVVSPSE
jgi:hypothetical protein